MCRSKKCVHKIQASSEDDSHGEYSINIINLNKQKSQRIQTVEMTHPDSWTAKLNMNNTMIKIKIIDPSAEINVLPRKLFKNLSPKPKWNKTTVKICKYSFHIKIYSALTLKP